MKKPVCLSDSGVIEFMEYCATSWGNNRPYPTMIDDSNEIWAVKFNNESKKCDWIRVQSWWRLDVRNPDDLRSNYVKGCLVRLTRENSILSIYGRWVANLCLEPTFGQATEVSYFKDTAALSAYHKKLYDLAHPPHVYPKSLPLSSVFPLRGTKKTSPTEDHNLTHQEALQMIHEITEYEALQFA